MITLKDARQVIAAAERKAREIGQPMNIAVVDAENIQQEKCNDAYH
jgi:uncharacterized protein GlcG (DUF336 family)